MLNTRVVQRNFSTVALMRKGKEYAESGIHIIRVEQMSAVKWGTAVVVVALVVSPLIYMTDLHRIPTGTVLKHTPVVDKVNDAQSAQRIFDQELREILSGNWKSVDIGPLDAIAQLLPRRYGEGHSGELVVERQLYYRLAQMSHVKRICEIGFNKGHSTSLWLLANPTAEVVMFELKHSSWVKKGIEFLHSGKAAELGLRNVSGRLRIVFGNSAITVRAIARLEPSLKCDLLSVDGNHEHFGALQDVVDMHALANPDRHVAVIDDTNCMAVYCVDKALEEAQRRNLAKVLLRLAEHGPKQLGEYMAAGGGPDVPSYRGVTLFQYSML